ncbi:MAG: hypothetical protein RLZZ387_3394 [Chloroflexota bacterium]
MATKVSANKPRSSEPADGHEPSTAPGRMSRRGGVRRGYIWGGVCALALIAVVGLRVWAAAQSATAVIADIRSVEALARDPERLLTEGAVSLASTRQHLAALRGDLWPLPAVGAWLGWLPGYGADLAALGPLLDASDHTLAATESMLVAAGPLAPTLRALDRAAVTAPELSQQLAAARPSLEHAQARAEQAMLIWEQIDPEALSPLIGPRVAQVRSLATLLPGAASLSIATIDLHASLAPLFPLLRAGDPAQLLAGDSATLTSLTRAAELLPLARASTERAADDLARAQLDGLPEGRQAQLLQLAELPGLYLAVISSLEVGQEVAAIVTPILAEQHGGRPLGAALASGLAARRAELDGARLRMGEVISAWEQVRADRLPQPLREAVEQMPARAAEAGELIELAQLLPGLLGAGGGRDYLVLALSGDELRPGGGFITSAGVLRLQDGRVAGLSLEDSGKISPRAGVASPYAPEPLGRYMQIYRWFLRDSNWSPDFPTSARMAGILYGLSGRTAPPDVAAINVVALQELLRVTGPVAVAGEADPISADTVVAFFERHHGLQNDNSAPVTALAQALLDRIERGDMALPALLKVAHQLLDQRHIQIAVAEPAAAEHLAGLGWDGAVRPGGRDFLMVVDANVGYTKANRNIRERLSYTVDLTDPMAPLASLAIGYTHTGTATGTCAELDAEPASYSSMLARCHRTYLRVLVPAASALLSAENGPSPGEWTWSGLPDDGMVSSGVGEAGASVFATYLALPPGAERTVALRYSLPLTVIEPMEGGYRYGLRIQKQAGREPIPIQIRLNLPPGASVVWASAGPARPGATTFELTTSLVRDLDLEIHIQAS